MKRVFCLLVVSLLMTVLSACTRDGSIGKEGIYEAFKNFDRSQNPSFEHSETENMSYGEYESLLKEGKEK